MSQEPTVSLPRTEDGHAMRPGDHVWVTRLRGLGRRPRLDRVDSLTWLGDEAGWLVNLERHEAIPERSESFSLMRDNPRA